MDSKDNFSLGEYQRTEFPALEIFYNKTFSYACGNGYSIVTIVDYNELS